MISHRRNRCVSTTATVDACGRNFTSRSHCRWIISNQRRLFPIQIVPYKPSTKKTKPQIKEILRRNVPTDIAYQKNLSRKDGQMGSRYETSSLLSTHNV